MLTQVRTMVPPAADELVRTEQTEPSPGSRTPCRRRRLTFVNGSAGAGEHPKKEKTRGLGGPRVRDWRVREAEGGFCAPVCKINTRGQERFRTAQKMFRRVCRIAARRPRQGEITVTILLPGSHRSAAASAIGATFPPDRPRRTARCSWRVHGEGVPEQSAGICGLQARAIVSARRARASP